MFLIGNYNIKNNDFYNRFKYKGLFVSFGYMQSAINYGFKDRRKILVWLNG